MLYFFDCLLLKGSGAGLLGESAIPLAIWMAERLESLEATERHWCTQIICLTMFDSIVGFDKANAY